MNEFYGYPVVSILQESFEDKNEKKSAILLIRDKDGIFKILKELFDYNKKLPQYLNEDDIYLRLPEFVGLRQINRELPFLPRYYCTIETATGKFIKRSFVYGQNLSYYCEDLLSQENAIFVMQKIIEKLYHLLTCRLLLLDLKPENILISFNDVSFVDLGLSQFIDSHEEIRGVISHPRYTAPETVTRQMVSEKSMVFQLGIIANELLTGKHPLDLYADEKRSMDWDVSLDRHVPLICSSIGKTKYSFISCMLDPDPGRRPTLLECHKVFKSLSQPTIYINRKGLKHSKDDYVLFPARMGIPHKGHIEYMSRILDIGYKLIISIQRAYTITDRDPIPKWLAMKMVARSLLELGYSRDDFEFIFTPFYGTQTELFYHFDMMPHKDEIIAVASSNPDVHNLFPSIDVITQRDVFGFEGEQFEDRSWGEALRRSVKDDDYNYFKEFAAIGVEKILTFDEIKRTYGQPNIEFVSGVIKVKLDTSSMDEMPTAISCEVMRYCSPEESIVQCIDEHFDSCQIVDAYQRDSVIKLNNKNMYLSYVKTELDCGNETIYFKLI